MDEFLQKMGELFECVLFTASLAKVSQHLSHICHRKPCCCHFTSFSFSIQYADPVADLLDQWGVFRARLFRESCVFHRGNYVKDLSRLGRELSKVIIIDNSPASYIFHPENAVSPSIFFHYVRFMTSSTHVVILFTAVPRLLWDFVAPLPQQ